MKLPPLSRPLKVSAAVVATAAFLASLGAVPAFAAWTATAQATSTASAPTVAVTQSGFDGLTATYLNSALTSTGSFTVTNTGGAPGAATVDVSTPGAFAAALPVRVWTVADAAACTAGTAVPGTAASGTWATFPSVGPVALAPAASTTFCVRTTVTDRNTVVSTTGTQTATPSIAATLAVGSWKVTATATAVTQSTAQMFPAATGYRVEGAGANWFMAKSGNGQCLDVSGSSVTVGAAFQTYSCNNSAAQRIEFVPIPGTALVTMRARSSGLLNVAVNASNKTVLAVPNSAAPEQQWRVDRSSATTYMIVSASTGLCFTTGASGGQAGVIACDGTALQSATLTREVLSCSANGAVLTAGFGGYSGRQATLQYRAGQDGWATAGTIPSNSTSFNATLPVTTTQRFEIRIVDDQGAVTYSGMTALANSTTKTVSCGAAWT